jgi:hypothetical protein
MKEIDMSSRCNLGDHDFDEDRKCKNCGEEKPCPDCGLIEGHLGDCLIGGIQAREIALLKVQLALKTETIEKLKKQIRELISVPFYSPGWVKRVQTAQSLIQGS